MKRAHCKNRPAEKENEENEENEGKENVPVFFVIIRRFLKHMVLVQRTQIT